MQWLINGKSPIGGHLITDDEGVDIAIVPGGGKRRDGADNGRRVGAAPELLGWAEVMLSFIDVLAEQQGIKWAYREDARDAIAKARGQS